MCGADTAPRASAQWSACILPSRCRLSLAVLYFSSQDLEADECCSIASFKRKWFPVINSSRRQASSLSNSDEEWRALTQRCLKRALPALVRTAAWSLLQSQKTKVLGVCGVCCKGATRPSHSGGHSGIFVSL